MSIADDAAALLSHVPMHGAAMGNDALRQALGWDEPRYVAARDALFRSKALAKGRGPGNGNTVKRVTTGDGPLPPTPTAPAPAPTLPRPAATRRTALTKSELYASLWASCDELRGGMDASQYKDFVLVLLFVKYVSDKLRRAALRADPDPREGASFADHGAAQRQPPTSATRSIRRSCGRWRKPITLSDHRRLQRRRQAGQRQGEGRTPHQPDRHLRETRPSISRRTAPMAMTSSAMPTNT